MSCVVDDDVNARIGIGPVGVIFTPELDDYGINLDGINMNGAMLQGRGNIRSRACAEHENVLKRVSKSHVGPLVEVFLLAYRGHRLVKDVVHLYHHVPICSSKGNLVVW